MIFRIISRLRRQIEPPNPPKQAIFRRLFPLALLVGFTCSPTPEELHQDAWENINQGRLRQGLSLLEKAFDLQWGQIGSLIIDQKAKNLQGNPGGNRFLYEKGGFVHLVDVNTSFRFQTKKKLPNAYYRLSTRGRAVLEFLPYKNGCVLQYYDVQSKHKATKIELPAGCKLPLLGLDTPLSYPELANILREGEDFKSTNEPPEKPIDPAPDNAAESQANDQPSGENDQAEPENGEGQTARNQKRPAILPTGILAGLREGLWLIDPRREKRVKIIDYEKLPSPYPLVPPRTFLYGLHGRQEILVARGNAGSYRLYHLNLVTKKHYKFPMVMKLPYLKVGANGDSILFIRGGAGKERIYKMYLYEKKQKRYKQALREQPFDDPAGNIFYMDKDQLHIIPVIGKSRSLPLKVRAFFPLDNNLYLVETLAGNIMKTPLYFNPKMQQWFLEIQKVQKMMEEGRKLEAEEEELTEPEEAPPAEEAAADEEN